MQVFVLFIAVAVLQFGGFADGAMSTIVESGEEECFAVYVPPGEMSMISGNFECLDDDLKPGPIGVTLYDPKMTPAWRSRAGATEGKFTIYGTGKHELCIQNGQLGSDDFFAPPDGNDREVGFAVRVTPPSRGLEGAAGPDDRLTSHLMEMSTKLLDGMHTMSDHQEYMRERENRHTILADTTFDRVVQWTVLEAVVLILISLGQVLYLRKFFEQRRYL